MKTLKTILAASFCIGITGTAVASENGYSFNESQLIPSSARLEVGGTGYGGALTWEVSPKVGVTLGYNGGDISWDSNIKVNGSKYDIDTKNRNTYLNAEIRPWGGEQTWAKDVYVAAGVAYIDTRYDIDRKVRNGADFKVDHKDFTAIDGVKIDGKLKFDNNIAPYLGLGWAPKFSQNWGAFGEIGAYYTGNPKVQLTGYGEVDGLDSEYQEAVKAEERKIADKDRYKWLPVAKIGVNYYW